jgi:ubiquinone/menaquinone biosynthesis C-methylase UbiE
MTDDISFSGSVPSNYDKYLGPLLFEPYALDLFERLKNEKINNLLELACGTGRLTNHLAKLIPSGGQLVATDINPDMIEVAKGKVPGHIKWEVVDAHTLPYEKNSFDHVVCQFGVMFFTEKEKAFYEIQKVLKEGGKFIFNTWDSLEYNPRTAIIKTILDETMGANAPDFLTKGPYSFYDIDDIRDLLDKTGFHQVDIHIVPKSAAYTEPEELIKGFIYGSPLSAYLQTLSDGTREIIENKLRERFIAQFGREDVHVPMQALVCEAIK